MIDPRETLKALLVGGLLLAGCAPKDTTTKGPPPDQNPEPRITSDVRDRVKELVQRADEYSAGASRLPGRDEMSDRQQVAREFELLSQILPALNGPEMTGDFRQALRIIADYPILGVGFGGAPEVGTFVGVSSIYLLVGEQTGLLGLGLFLLTLAALGIAGLRAAVSASDPEDRALAGTLLAPFVAAILVGNLDHYFMNPQFPHMVALFWLYGGLLAASAQLAASPVAQPDPPNRT